MKRSEVLDLIDEVLHEHDLPLLQGISKEILGRLEKAGMAPPFDQETFIKQKNRWGIELAHGREWTPEDEA